MSEQVKLVKATEFVPPKSLKVWAEVVRDVEGRPRCYYWHRINYFTEPENIDKLEFKFLDGLEYWVTDFIEVINGFIQVECAAGISGEATLDPNHCFIQVP